MFNLFKIFKKKASTKKEAKEIALNKAIHLVLSCATKGEIVNLFPEKDRDKLKAQYDDGMQALTSINSKFKKQNKEVELLKINNMLRIVFKYMHSKKSNNFFLEKR